MKKMDDFCKTTRLHPKTGALANRPAIALVLTLVVLAVLTTIVYALCSRLAQFKHRQQYLIDYQISRYACDSAMKYALIAIKGMKFNLIKRADKPDFSDLFTMNQEEYTQFLDEWAQQIAEQESVEKAGEADSAAKRLADSQGTDNVFGDNQSKNLLGDLMKSLNEPNSIADANDLAFDTYTDPNILSIPGPYGPQWPHVCKPIKFEIGKTKVAIEITDENAKMPLTWAITGDKKVSNLAANALEIFGEWMQMDLLKIGELADELEEIQEIKPFKIDPKPVTVTKKPQTKPQPKKSKKRRSRRPSRSRAKEATKTKRPTIAHTTDFAKLLHSSVINIETLAEPLPDTGDRHESPLKYLALWGSQRININTAPRHVLEAAFTFGGDAEDIAAEIIQRRREKPFKNIEELESSLYRYTGSIKKTKPYITTASTFFAIKIKAVNGKAKTSIVATVIKSGKTVEPIAIISNL
jgi:hypothetical protein